ncbi:hypothetical protein [Moraxella pluranimalium]|uniref:Uncharacterized protein n=1 Tax=Moraxella pluranimalium TaxID=470453 RepID=A0A1T0CIW7_9GAMM|nr:hypothetical protein [Moraxella pluranimalium]OOS22091.1 hypothetical protein B0680_09635 [Moraxella pluranimalium]
MKVINVLTALALVCLPTLAVANNLPFVGKRDFDLTPATGNVPPGLFGGSGSHYRYIEINKNGRVKITGSGCAGVASCSTNTLYQGKYQSVMPIGYGEYVSVLNKNQIAYTDKYGNILNECTHFYSEEDYIEGQPCIGDLRKVRK